MSTKNAIESPYPRLSDMLRYGRHELMGNLRVPFYERAGDKSGYQGYPYRHWGRYQLTCRDYVKLGVVFSQDASEPFLANCNKAGYDFYSYYLQLKHLHRIENLVVGNYKLSAGMGLVLNNSFAMGKLVALQQLGRSTNTVRPHASRSQSGYFRGAAATVSLSQHSQFTAFASYRPQGCYPQRRRNGSYLARRRLPPDANGDRQEEQHTCHRRRCSFPLPQRSLARRRYTRLYPFRPRVAPQHRHPLPPPLCSGQRLHECQCRLRLPSSPFPAERRDGHQQPVPWPPSTV